MHLKYILDLVPQTFHGGAGLCVNRMQQDANEMPQNCKTQDSENTFSKRDLEGR